MLERNVVTVMLGGPSAEREVSLRSGEGAAAALRSLGHTVHELDPRTPDWSLPPDTEVVFLALHGTYGEDGTVQQQLEELGIPYTGCGPEASRLGFDKILTKEKCVAAGIPTAKYVIIESASASWPMGWTPPVVLKPACQGSSVGLQIVERVGDWSQALTEALRYDARVLVEEKISGRECTVGILGRKPLPIVEIRPRTGINDYQTKYTPGTTDVLCPAPFEEAVAARISQAALGAFDAIGGRDYARVDVMVRANGEPVILEVNTLPGMTPLSLLPKAAAAEGIGYPELCQRMIEMALGRRKQKPCLC